MNGHLRMAVQQFDKLEAGITACPKYPNLNHSCFLPLYNKKPPADVSVWRLHSLVSGL